MALLDYSIPQFQFLVGAFDCTDYLDEIALSLPIHEITQKLTWSGRFKVSYNRKAIANGLTENQFDQGATPSLWRPAQQPIRLSIKNYSLPVMRIERYAYNPQTGIGEGTLHQIVDAVAVDRPATKAEIEIYYTNLNQVVQVLVSNGFRGSAVVPGQAVGGLQGEILGGVITKNPINDAQRLLGTQWRSLTVDNNEVVRSHYCGTGASLFNRTLNQIEIEPDIDHINFAASRVIVTGSRQVPKDIESVPGSPKPKLQKTEEKLPYNEVYPGSDVYTTPQTFQVLAEKKRIHYQYEDDDSVDLGVFGVALGMGIAFDLQTRANRVYPGDPSKPYQTMTIKEWPIGRIRSLGDNSNLALAVVELQTENRRRIWTCRILITGNITNTPADFDMVLQKDEKLTTPPTTSTSNQSSQIDPRTGLPELLEPKPIIEGQKPIADQPMKTEPIAGLSYVSPAGWSPIQPQDLIVEVGFLPNKAVASQLASNIAQREQRRRDSLAVTMPIPDEWLAAGCPILPTVSLWDGVWLAEGLIVSLAGTEAKFAFTASRISRLGLPVASVLTKLDIRAAPFVRVLSGPRLGNPIEGQAGGTTIPIEGQEGGTTILIEQNS